MVSKKIGENAFYQCPNLNSVVFEEPSILNSIPDHCFFKCQSFTSIYIPSSCKCIGDFALSECKSLRLVEFEKSNLEKIGISAFCNCTSLEKITIPSSVKELQSDAFKGCKSLTEVEFELPCSLTILETRTFEGCRDLTHISIPSSITKIGYCCFKKCRLSEITFDDNSSLAEILFSAFEGNSFKQICIPSSVKKLYGAPFLDCYDLEKDIINSPSSIFILDIIAFNGCISLKEIIVPKDLNVNDSLPDYEIKITRI